MAPTFFFVLSKVVGFILYPATWLVVALLVAARHAGGKNIAAAGRWLKATLAATVLLAAYPLGDILVAPLENRYPANPPLARVDGIVVLGGALNPQLSRIHRQPQTNDAAERLIAGLELARRYPGARVVFTGGSGSVQNQTDKEAGVGADLLVAAGLSPERLIIEDQSRNTYENAILSRRIAQPQPNERWVLVTSAWHMPRSVGVFCVAEWPVVPYPVDYRAGGLSWWPDWDLPEHATTLRQALKEWLGLAVYRLTGRFKNCDAPAK